MNEPLIKFRCLPVTQPVGTFFIGVMDASDLISISFADVRRPEGREIERYIGTQRELSENRVKELEKYVTNVDASFPTGIILSVRGDDAEYDEKAGILSLRKDEKVAKIIDGQHRIAGLQVYAGDQLPFQLNVIIFVEIDIEDQAMIFATINLKQTKVSKSLAYDLYEYTKTRSPQKSCHDIAKLMNSKSGSPLENRIKILGKATGAGVETITQAAFVDRLLKLITSDAMADRDALKREKPIESVSRRQGERLIFREFFRKEKDAEIARVLWNYLTAVSERWPTAWNDLGQGQILGRTTGFAAVMRLLPLVWKKFDFPEVIPAKKTFLSLLSEAQIEDKEFNSKNFKPGSAGEGALFRRLADELQIDAK